MLESPISFENADAGASHNLRQRLVEIGYSPKPVASLLGLGSVSDLYPLDYRRLPRFVELLGSTPQPLAAAVRLLLLGLPCGQDQVKTALGEPALAFCLKCGLLTEADGTVHAILSIVPFRQLLIATDKLFMNADPDFVESGLSSDNCVWRLDRTTLIMSKNIKKLKVENALELGCGSGVLSLLTSRNAKTIIGIDINPRAVNVARFNARLNGIDNAEFLRGDLYQPIKGEQFDYIFSNPPSAPGLVRAWNREGGPTGRDMVEGMVRGLEEHLAPGGVFQTTMHFGFRNKGDVKKWVSTLLPDKGFDISIKELTKPQSAVDFALNEAYQKAGPRDYGMLERTYRTYRDGMERAGYGQVGFGLAEVSRK